MRAILILFVTVLLGAADANIPAGLIGTYHVRFGGLTMQMPAKLETPRELVTVSATTVSLRWDDLVIKGNITDILITEHPVPIIALVVKNDTSTYWVHFSFAEKSYGSEVLIMVEDKVKRVPLGAWREGRKRE